MSSAVVLRCEGTIEVLIDGTLRSFGRCSRIFTDPTAAHPGHAREHAEDAGWHATPGRDLCPGHRHQLPAAA